MHLFEKLFKGQAQELTVSVHLNARYQPIDRGAYEDLTERFLQERGWGRLGTGGGTRMAPEGSPAACDFDIVVARAHLDEVCAALDKAFYVPKGSRLIIGKRERPIGQQEGLALYLNGTELPETVYRTSDVNAVIQGLEAHLGEARGRFLSFWMGPKETALYFYGPSYAEMKAALEEIIPRYPLCDKCRMEQIA